MSRRIKSAEESARKDREASRRALLTLVADSTAPRDPRSQGPHYRQHLLDAHIVIEKLQERIAGLEADLAKTKRDAAYNLSLCVSRTVAEEAMRKAAIAMRYRASDLAEGRQGEPTNTSHAIECLPLPRPKFVK
jgi:hypothetical protein